MLEIYEKINGEHTNKSIKLNDLGMNQSIEFTPKFCKTGTGQFGEWYNVAGTYHSEEGDEEVTIWASKSTYPQFDEARNKRVTIKKVKPEGAKFHSYQIYAGTRAPKVKAFFKPKEEKFKFLTDNLSDDDGSYTEVEMVKYLKTEGLYDNIAQYKKMWTDYGSDEERGTEVFNHRSEAI